MTVDEQIAAIKKRIESARLQRARAEVGKESAEKQYVDAKQTLKDKFGVDSPTEVRAKLVELQDDLAAKVAEIEQILNAHNL